MPCALMVAQTGMPKQLMRRESRLDPLRNAHLRSSLKQTTRTTVDCLDSRHEFLPRLDIAEKNPMGRLQPTIGPDNGRDDRRNAPLGLDMVKPGMPEQDSGAGAKPTAAEIIRHYLRRSRFANESLNCDLSLRGGVIFWRAELRPARRSRHVQ